MENSFFSSNTYGIGQLITQKKRLEVPLHQRNYSWESSEVDQFIEDIFTAIDEKYVSYFLGSLVITQPSNGVWGILDGQQRLTTVSIVYSCIRYLLMKFKRNNDSEQIENEFLGVRNLGGEYSSRLILNEENKDIYNQIVVNLMTTDELQKLERSLKGNRSNLLLLRAVLHCRRRIEEWIYNHDEESMIRKLYKLSSYLETKVLVVSIEVADESDAYMVFETLNTRGQDLSALDLVKNYIFGKIDDQNFNTITDNWNVMKSNIGDKQADDFLRIFWMGNYGLIQKSRLYASLKRKFETADEIFNLSNELCNASEIYAAIEEPKHEFWHRYSPYCRHLVEILVLLKGKQTRPILFACAKSNIFDVKLMEEVLWNVVVLTIRFQTIGKRRQGILERQCAKIAQYISSQNIIDINYITVEISKIIPNDEEFYADFSRFHEINMKRALYFLVAIDFFGSTKLQYSEIWQDIEQLIDTTSNVSVSHIVPRSQELDWKKSYNDDIDNLDLVSNIANYVLIESNSNISFKNKLFNDYKIGLTNHMFWSTREIAQLDVWDYNSFVNRQNTFSEIAVKLWKLSR